MSAIYENIRLPKKEDLLTVESLDGFELPEGFVPVDTKLKSNTSKESADKKLVYLISQGYALPEDWYHDLGDADIEVSLNYVPCITTLYSLIAKAVVISTVLKYVKDRIISTEDAQIALDSTNALLEEKIESRVGWRKKIHVNGLPTTVEGLYRMNGDIVNTDANVSTEELVELVRIFKNHFIPKK